MLPPAPSDANAQTGNVTRLGPMRTCRLAPRPGSGRSNESRSAWVAPPYRRDPKSIRSIVWVEVDPVTWTFAPGQSTTWKAFAPGITAMDARSK